MSAHDWYGIWEALSNTMSGLHLEVLESVFVTSHTGESYGYLWTWERQWVEVLEEPKWKSGFPLACDCFSIEAACFRWFE